MAICQASDFVPVSAIKPPQPSFYKISTRGIALGASGIVQSVFVDRATIRMAKQSSAFP
jgi:hypothetical protein